VRLQFSCCGAVGPQDFMKSAWFNRSDVTGVYVPGSCCVDRPTLDTGGKQVVLSAAAKIIDCQLTAERYIRSVNKPDGPDPSLAGGLHFLQTQVGYNFKKNLFFYVCAWCSCEHLANDFTYFTGDIQTDRQTNRRTSPLRKAPLLRVGGD